MPKTLRKLTHQPFTFDCAGRVSARAFREIRDKVCGWHGLYWGQVEPLMNEIGSTFEVADKNSTPSGLTGSYSKRLANALYKKWDVRLTDNEKAVLGEMARRGMPSATYYGQVVEKIDWDAGDFGDKGSCFWGGRQIARHMITTNKGGALLMWRDEYHNRGAGRCFIFPILNVGYVLFNAYGDIPLEGHADALAAAFKLGAPYQIDLRDHGEWSGTFWINGGKGIVVPTVSRRIENHDLQLKEIQQCNNCGQYNFTARRWKHNYCPSCFSRMSMCDQCHHPSFEMVETPTGRMCERCAYERYAMCDMCNRFVDREQIVRPVPWRVHCPDCQERYEQITHQAEEAEQEARRIRRMQAAGVMPTERVVWNTTTTTHTNIVAVTSTDDDDFEDYLLFEDDTETL